MYNDCHVFHRDILDPELAAAFERPWIVETPDGYQEQFDNEDEACAWQRGYRVALGLDPMTGVPKA